uniref:NME/NM23 nucleoside diphosphate kinase 6 n=1 Tax=Petromyzon marinus TaxID=7757 RepID=S4R4Z0_PETMA
AGRLMAGRGLQLTLALLKPDALAHGIAWEAVHQDVLKNKFLIVKSKELRLKRSDSERFYAAHKGKFFFQRLVEFMASGPIRVYVLAHHDAVRGWRELMGPTKVFRAVHTAPESIRACYGLTDTRNTTHGSDSSASALQEISFFFPEFDVACWCNTWEPAFRAGCVSYHPKLCVH